MAIKNLVQDDGDLPIGGADFDYEEAPIAQTTGLVVFDETANIQFDSSELAIPYLKLAQGMTKEVKEGSVRPGHWFADGIPETKTLDVTFVHFARSRQLLDDNMMAPTTYCQSGDSFTGHPTEAGVAAYRVLESTEDRVCASCPLQAWGTDPKTGKSTKPPCVFKSTYRGYTVIGGAKVPFEVSFKRTTLAIAKSINTYIQTYGLRKFTVRLGVKMNQRGNPEPTVTLVAPTAL